MSYLLDTNICLLLPAQPYVSIAQSRREQWDRKREWYEANGFWDRVITSEDGPDGGIDASEIERTARKRILLENGS
jgi:hypothetical protein